MITVVEKEWGLSTWSFEDRSLASQLYRIVDRKTQEARKLGLAVPIHCAVTYYMTNASAPLLGAQLLHGPRGEFTVVFSNQEGPALAFECKADSSTIIVHYKGERPTRTLVNQRVRELSAFSLLTPETYPYGWVEDGRITVLFFTAEYDYDEEREQFLGGEPCVYVLEGASMPSELRMAKSDSGWAGRIIDLIKSGRLISLRKRVHELPGEVWSGVDNKGRYVSFDESDGRNPAFATDARYLHWHPREAHPGELFDFSGAPMKVRLRKWLSW
ncbi:MAG TPA: hypothetical protein VFH06_02550 [Candidatus Saccharimonadales bacterium]|nr:hypothetical protein [Candidatus Saccharimonadales bacterium]